MEQNQNRPRFDFTTFIPVGIGVVSLFGICLLLIASRLAAPRAVVQVPDTATPFQYLFLGTEPGISSAVPSAEGGTPFEGGEIPPLDGTPGPSITTTPRTGFAITAQSGFSSNDGSSSTEVNSTDDPVITFPGTKNATLTVGPAEPTKSPTNTFVPTPTWTSLAITRTPISIGTLLRPTNTLPAGVTPTRTPTSAGAAPLNPGTYDDADSHLVYGGNWVYQTNVASAYEETLHVSSTLGNTITFRFIGQELRLFYQSGPSLGLITITIDQKTFELQQGDEITATSEWVSEFFPSGGTHTVVIEHADGGSVNLDQIIIPDIVPTATSP